MDWKITNVALEATNVAEGDHKCSLGRPQDFIPICCMASGWIYPIRFGSRRHISASATRGSLFGSDHGFFRSIIVQISYIPKKPD